MGKVGQLGNIIKYEDMVVYSYNPGKKKLIVMCPGFPGDCKNYDLAGRLANRDKSVMLLKYPGVDESRGIFRFPRAVYYVTSFLSDLPNFCDYKELTVIGHSYGGFYSINAVSENDGVDKLICLAPLVDIEKFNNEQDMKSIFEDALTKVRGTCIEELINEQRVLKQKYDPLKAVKKIKCPLVLIHGDSDKDVPIYHSELLYKHANKPKELITISGADHIFSKHRYQLFEEVLKHIE